jgi:hypothetical protein
MTSWCHLEQGGEVGVGQGPVVEIRPQGDASHNGERGRSPRRTAHPESGPSLPCLRPGEQFFELVDDQQQLAIRVGKASRAALTARSSGAAVR